MLALFLSIVVSCTDANITIGLMAIINDSIVYRLLLNFFPFFNGACQTVVVESNDLYTFIADMEALGLMPIVLQIMEQGRRELIIKWFK